MDFSTLIAGVEFHDAVLRAHISEDWMQGRTVYGGLSVALCFETARRTVADLPPLRSINTAFIGPATGMVEGRARILRRGKSVCFVEVDLSGEAGLAVRCCFAFGDARPSALDTVWAPKPAVPGPSKSRGLVPDKGAPNFIYRFETLLASGAPPMTGAAAHDHFVWVRHRDPIATGVGALLALADALPPAVLAMAKTPAPVSSVTWIFNLLTSAPETDDGWWLLQCRAEQAGQGYSSQDMLIWNANLQLVASGKQSVAVFF